MDAISPSDHVEVIEGDFTGFSGVVLEVVGDSANVAFTIFGRTTAVLIPLAYLRKV